MVQQENSKHLYNTIDAAEYLDIPYGLFEAYIRSNLIFPTSKDTFPMFEKKELDRFKQEYFCREKNAFGKTG